MTDTFFSDVNVAETQLLTDLKQMVQRHADNHPRSQQKALGPSQIGHPCLRHLAQSMHGSDEIINPPGDPLPAYIGTAVHSRLEDAVAQDNARRDRPRWLSETKVEVRQGLSGTCDLYGIDTGTVVDFKAPGSVAMTTYRKQGPSPEYRIQAHAYGHGFARLGFNVNTVGIWFLPRAGRLSTSHLWTEPYDESIVRDALGRIDLATLMMDDLDVDNHPERFAVIPKTPHNCGWCPWWSPASGHANPLACTGDAQ